jgi:hypothetical protein
MWGWTCGSSCLLWNYCHPILKPIYPLSILHHLFEFLSRIVGLVGSRNIQFLIAISCAHALLQLAIIYKILFLGMQLEIVNFKHHGMSFARRWVGPFTKISILAFKNESARPFPYSILSHFPGIPKICKLIVELPHHALFHFTCFAVKNFDT